jgi:hypothetical protein
MDHDFWLRACNASKSRTPSDLQQANYGAGIVAVTALIPQPQPTLSRHHIHKT